MTITQTILRLLSFKLMREEMLGFNKWHLIAGVAGTWIVGMGRYWDDEKASTLQHLGFGSVIYVFLLSLFIWIILLPFKIEHWKYFTVLIFISLTSFPAIFYAIPVERFFSLETSSAINAWFLAVVATWRLCLLFFFLKRFSGLSTGNVIIATLLPVCVIISSLTLLNLHHVVFVVMGGIRDRTSYDDSYGILMLLTGVSLVLTIPLLITYGYAIYQRRNKKP